MNAADYVIVGAGSAGCVLANRLSEDPDVRVLLLEAGGRDRSLNVKIPAAFPKQFHTRLDWDFHTEPEPHCEGRSLYVPRGKTLGGSSSMNAMLYVRGRPLDYDLWKAAGAAGWGWDDVLPYFLKAENNERGASEFHAVGGPLNVADQRSPRPLNARFLAAAEAVGIPRIDDLNGPEQDGVTPFQVTQRDGRRWSTADGYLRPALERPNLEVVTRAHALGLEWDGGRVAGVRYARRGRRALVARAEREVILSAGAIGSPQLLMLSGHRPGGRAAPRGHRAAPRPARRGRAPPGPPVRDRAVRGARHRHPLRRRQAQAARRVAAAPQRPAHLHGRRGLRVRAHPSGLPAADIQFHIGALFFEDHGETEFDGHAATFGPVLVSTRSRGRVWLRSADPRDKPRILTNTLAEQDDVDSLVAGVKLAREMAASGPMADTVVRELRPGADASTDADIEASVRRRVELLYHPVGTCAMGDGEDAVLDPELRVRGLDGLRVVDASVFPSIPGGNTNAPTIMVAERAADLIRGRA